MIAIMIDISIVTMGVTMLSSFNLCHFCNSGWTWSSRLQYRGIFNQVESITYQYQYHLVTCKCNKNMESNHEKFTSFTVSEAKFKLSQVHSTRKLWPSPVEVENFVYISHQVLSTNTGAGPAGSWWCRSSGHAHITRCALLEFMSSLLALWSQVE